MNTIKIPIWFWIVAVFFILWNAMGLFTFFAHFLISEEDIAKLPLKEQDLYNQYPIWVNIVFAIAVFSGFLGSLALILKKKWAITAFIISLCAIIPQMIHNFFFTTSIEVYGVAQAITMPILVIVIGIFLVFFSKFAAKKNWLV